jgi:hypothetical protein
MTSQQQQQWVGALPLERQKNCPLRTGRWLQHTSCMFWHTSAWFWVGNQLAEQTVKRFLIFLRYVPLPRLPSCTGQPLCCFQLL